MELTKQTSERHIPVLLDECLGMMSPALTDDGAVLVDCTLGMGGHSEAALKRFPNIHLIGIDRDPQAISLASERLAPFADRFTAVHTTYDHVDEVVATYAPAGKADAILMDLGVSSFQLDEAERGFSYSADAPLDMRMDPTRGQSAAELLVSATAQEIAQILRVYGEERFASRIARRIVETRETQPLTRTGQLADIVRASIPAAARRRGGNPSKRTFQALRIAVNDELNILERALPACFASLRIGGRLVVESYQSLEDRIVKDLFRRASTVDVPQGLPVIPDSMAPSVELLTRKVHQADEAERAHNPRSASVRLRGAQLVREWKELS